LLENGPSDVLDGAERIDFMRGSSFRLAELKA
jgi:hypothetical protein